MWWIRMTMTEETYGKHKHANTLYVVQPTNAKTNLLYKLPS